MVTHSRSDTRAIKPAIPSWLASCNASLFLLPPGEKREGQKGVRERGKKDKRGEERESKPLVIPAQTAAVPELRQADTVSTTTSNSYRHVLHLPGNCCSGHNFKI